MDGPGNGDDGCAVGGGGDDCDRSVGGGDAVDLLAAVDLVVCHGAEDGRENHSGGVEVDEVLVQLDAAACGFVGDFGSANGEVRGCGIEGDGGATESDMNIA